MTASMTDRLDATGPAAPPRENGELVFAAPWESRLFGMTLALCEAGRLDWEAFRQLLIEEIGGWEAAGHPPEAWSYYACWAAALEQLLASRGLCGADELRQRATALAARPEGHDH